MDILEKCRALKEENHVFLIMNFEEKYAEQFKQIKAIENPICSVFDIELYQRSNHSSLIDFIDLGFEDTRYLAEKRKGGESSHKDHQAVKVQVDTLCIEELNKKTYPSAMQLSKSVAKRMVEECPKLLHSFQPYKTHLVDGSDWTNPTFYRWCKKAYKLFKNNPEVIN